MAANWTALWPISTYVGLGPRLSLRRVPWVEEVVGGEAVVVPLVHRAERRVVVKRRVEEDVPEHASGCFVVSVERVALVARQLAVSV